VREVLRVLERARSSRTRLDGAELFRREAARSRRIDEEIAAAFVLSARASKNADAEPELFRERWIEVADRGFRVQRGSTVERGRLHLTHRVTGEETKLRFAWSPGGRRARIFRGRVSRLFTMDDLVPEDAEEIVAGEARDVLRAASELGLLPALAEGHAPRLFEEVLVQRLEAAAAAPNPEELRACADLARLGRRTGFLRRDGEPQQVLHGLLTSLRGSDLDLETQQELEALAAELGFAPGVAAAPELEGSAR
jgi:hypothetical protein